MDVINIACWFAAQLAFLILVSNVKDAICYVQKKPQNAITKVGDNVTFSCTSTTDKVTWWFACTRCNRPQRVRLQLYDGNGIVLRKFTSFATVTKSLDTNGLQSSLTISSVDRSHEGKYTCMDGDHDTAAGRLTVTESSPSSCLSVSPRDVVVLVGDTVLLEAASSTSKPRWYRWSMDQQIFNSKRMNHAIVDERYDVITGNSNDSHRADLVISDARGSDAGQYITSNTKEHIDVEVNVVVLERPIQCQVSSVAFRSVTLHCGFTYSGPLKPTITLNDVDVTNSSLNSSATGGTVESSFEVWFFDVLNDNVPRWTATFQLSRCGEVIDQYEWSMNIDNVGPMSHFIGNPKQLHLVIVVLAVASAAFLVGIIMCCCSCWLIRRRSKKDDVVKSTEDNHAYEPLSQLTRPRPLPPTTTMST